MASRSNAALAISHDSTSPPGNPASDRWLRKQVRWEDIEHRIKTGNILDLVYDFEATDLNTMYAAPTQFCGKIIDITGRLIDQVKIDIQVPEDIAISPQAAIITQSMPEELYSTKGRVPPHIAAAKMMLFFRTPYRALWDQLADHAITVTSNGSKEEEVRVYTIKNPNGPQKAEIRLHQGGKFLSYHYPDDSFVSRVGTLYDEGLSPTKNKAAALGAFNIVLKKLGVSELSNETIGNKAAFIASMQEVSHKLALNYPDAEDKFAAFLEDVQKNLNDGLLKNYKSRPEVARLPDNTTTYRDADGTRWKRVDAPAMTVGHNIRRYDDRLLWSFLHRAMSDEVFLTHTKKFRRFRVDTLDLAKLVALLDQGGENRFKPGIDEKTGRQSFSLSNLMKANTRDANPEVGRDEGIRMPDDSKYDEDRAHESGYDVSATMSLMAYLRKRAPEVVRMMEKNADFDRIKPFLMIDSKDASSRPVRAFARYIYPHKASLHFGVCAGINEEIEERRQAVMIRTDIDLEHYDFLGKKLLDMSVEELAEMLKTQGGDLRKRKRKPADPNALCEIIDLRKNPPVAEVEMARHRLKEGDLDRYEENRRWVLAHEDFCQKLLEAHSMAMSEMDNYRVIPNPQSEDHLFTGLAAPKWYEIDIGKGKKELFSPPVHAEWVKGLRNNRSIDALLRRAIKPQPVELEARLDTINAFVERMRTVDQHLQKYCGTTGGAEPVDIHPDPIDDADEAEAEAGHAGKPVRRIFKILPEPDHSFIPRKWDYIPDPNKKGKRIRVPHEVTPDELKQLTANAVEYLWKLRAELMYEFHDNTTHFTVQNKYGHDIPFPELNRMKQGEQGDLADRLRTGEYTIHMEELKWSRELIARTFFRDGGRIGWIKNYWATRHNISKEERDKHLRAWEEWERRFADTRAERIHGAPRLDIEDQRWMTATEGVDDIAKIRENLRIDDVPVRAEDDELGLNDIFMRNRHRSDEILNQCEKFLRRQLKDNPLTPEKQRRLGYDPDNNGMPIEYAKYEVPAGARILTIDVPDRMIEKPLSHHNVAHKFIMLEPDEVQRKALEEAGADTYLFLRGQQSGRTYLAAKPVVLPSDTIAPNHHRYNFQEIYDAAAKRFEDSGMTRPAPERLLPLAVEALEPVPGRVNRDAQTIKIPCWEDFLATVSPALGNRDAPLTGLVIQDYGFTPTRSPVRLQGMIQDVGKPGQTKSGWEVATTITGVQTLTLEEACERIEIGRKQIKAAAALQKDSVEAVRDALNSNSITEAQVEEAGLKSLKSLSELMKAKSFTSRDAVHYGYAGLTDMKSKLTAMFVDHELEVGHPDNLIHFVDIKPADKSNMSYHQPARRTTVRLAEDVVLPTETVAETSWRQDVKRRANGPHRR